MNRTGDDDRWTTAMTEWVRGVGRTLDRLEKDAARLANGIADVRQSMRTRFETLAAMADQPTVFTRPLSSPGPRPVYHSAERPCGRGLAVSESDRAVMLLGEALERRIRPCSFCGPKST